MATTFTRMDESTAEQWGVIGTETYENQGRVAERVLGMLRSLAEITDGFAVDQLTHSLQTATLAERAGADEEVVVAVAAATTSARPSACRTIPRIAAEILKPYVRDEVVQDDPRPPGLPGPALLPPLRRRPERSREPVRGASRRWFELAAQFADEWDQIAFDPDYDTLPLEHFEPLVRKVFGQRQADLTHQQQEAGGCSTKVRSSASSDRIDGLASSCRPCRSPGMRLPSQSLARREAVVCIPRRKLGAFFDDLDAGALDESILSFLAAPPAGRILRSADQASTPGLFDALGSPGAIAPGERRPGRPGFLGRGGGTPVGPRRDKPSRRSPPSAV